MATAKRTSKSAELKSNVTRIIENAKNKLEKSKGAESLFDHKEEIENQYKGKTAEQVWNMWNREQKIHFLKDHIGNYLPYILQEYPELNYSDFKTIDGEDGEVLRLLKSHIKEGEYEHGGEIKDYLVVAEKTYDNGVSYWTIISKPTTKEKAEIIKSESFVIDREVVKVVTSKEAKEHKHVVGREYLEKGGEMYEHGGKLHHNLNVFGYETKHFTEKAHNEFKEAIVKIEEQHLHAHFETKKEALRKCAFYLDKIFAGNSKKDLVYDIEMFAINNYRSDLHISLDIADSHIEEFKEGGLIEDKLIKELHKLQRELNSPRLSTYTVGDDSEEEKERKKERQVKLDRFNEILKLLREKENKKFEHGGSLEESNKDLVANKATEIAHYVKELHESLEHSEDVPAWVVSKIQRSATDIADVAHYLEGEEKEFGKGGKTVYKDEKYYGMTVEELERAADARERYSYDGADPAQKQSYLDSAKHHRELANELRKEQSDKMAKGGQTFASKTKAVADRLKGEDVPSKYQKTYGKKYSLKEAKEAAARIIGKQVSKEKMVKGGKLKVDRKYTHFAVRKSDSKIITGWEYKDLDKESIKEYTNMDLKDIGLVPKEYTILTNQALLSKGINPFDWANWWKNN